MSMSPPIEINPGSEHRCSVIWLHGLGADGRDFLPVAGELGLSDALGLRFVFPNAPLRPVSINNGYVMPAWYDIRHPDLLQEIDQAGIEASCEYLRGLIDAELRRGLEPAQIILAGFSQGGVIALRTALSEGRRLGGVLALSTYLPPGGDCIAPPLRIFQGHGRFDDIVPPAAAQASRDRLRALGHHVDWHSYPMAHAVCPEEIDDIRDWLGARCAG